MQLLPTSPIRRIGLTEKMGTFKYGAYMEERRECSVTLNKLECLGNAIVNIPEGFNIHPRLKRIMGARRKMVETGNNIDWSMGEALAFGSLADEGYLVRLSGQDVQRGDFLTTSCPSIDQKTTTLHPINEC